MGLLSIVIPAYNEEDGIAYIIEMVLKEKENIIKATDRISNVELIIVNDASKDKTAEIASKYSEVILVNHEKNKGYGGALKTGFKKSNGEYIGFLDADGTYPPEYFPKLCKDLIENDADIILGSRMAGKKSDMPFHRYIGNKFFAHFLSWIVGKKITDTASGMRVFKKSILPRLYPLPDGLNLTPAMSTQALHENLKIIEVPIPYEERVGRSKLNAITDGFRFLRTIVGIARLYNPLKIFGIFGFFMMLIGIILSIDPIVYYLKVRRVEDTEIYRLFSIMVLWMMGLNIITFGVFANNVLSIMHRKDIRQSNIFLSHIMRESIIKKFGLFGFLLMLSAVIVNYKTIYEYITTGHIYVHWSYIFTGATLFLVGLQMVMGNFLIRTLDELKEREKAAGKWREEA